MWARVGCGWQGDCGWMAVRGLGIEQKVSSILDTGN